ncbi:MAG TPA: 23S rRNA (adenine(2030)-N(6))-methyltransferase RlmJ [Methanotrichaceae archaeon]|nr:23S rRNA (adenine(2030)-N(6))-methyltransferase RlmJ [Methanotrichaceae archaeon]HQF15593.1 23S rRNA (adenine(2030)-N(6))-methyltransferase RlmJ [Methanotrichaceae archaeon]HQI90329.1 23S rRNA (adenine(2030)-N(6))-methyltransferase RlmJ [Methanotrichaceae archaeon]HQJ28572.1 23S rRNA (adenine(2030)-N(6))-methyltransferase RlmJ [Methanotrichaceae archaeon]
MGSYRHPVHAGNAGDVWKHLILGEAASFMLNEEGLTRYSESHSGEPDHLLESDGQWLDGIGRIWPKRAMLDQFSYIRVLQEMNPEDLSRYPGSSTLVLRIAAKAKERMIVHLFDTGQEVAKSWEIWPNKPQVCLSFHQRDGYSGSKEFFSAGHGLLFIDPPYTSPDEVQKSDDLFASAADAGWTALCWYPIELRRSKFPCPARAFELEFSEAGLKSRRSSGAGMAAYGSGPLLRHLEGRASQFLEICKDLG